MVQIAEKTPAYDLVVHFDRGHSVTVLSKVPHAEAQSAMNEIYVRAPGNYGSSIYVDIGGYRINPMTYTYAEVKPSVKWVIKGWDDVFIPIYLEDVEDEDA